ncbi:hypothetical protein NQZ68_003053 [Dissostichus eleginoides]|nr:hypothetical protein NQZ68_003053 [Dissostichus eleginoides]
MAHSTWTNDVMHTCHILAPSILLSIILLNIVLEVPSEQIEMNQKDLDQISPKPSPQHLPSCTFLSSLTSSHGEQQSRGLEHPLAT